MYKSLVFGPGFGVLIMNIQEKIALIPTHRRWNKLLDAVSGIQQLTIVLHNNPDPDAIAAGAALKFLLEKKAGLEVDIVYQGVIGRAENKALVDYLGVPLRQLPDENLRLPENLALVDTHTRAENNPISKEQRPLIVVDHHNNYVDGQAVFSDIRPNIGATATMMTEYLKAADCSPSKRLATALLYGIKTDTMALSRNTTTADVNAYCYLSELADLDAFMSFDKVKVSAGYFKGLAAAMNGARVYQDGLVITYLQELSYPDLVAEIADLMLRLEGSKVVIAFGIFKERIHFSIRTLDEKLDVNRLAQTLAGEEGNAGGRDMIAGGQIPVNDHNLDKLVAEVNQRILKFFKLSPQTEGEQVT
jgi:nanoRNase/pAp phosphatase (c-di-AMP/oligoRNAs hydrolase)